jgi:hypothetical protein
VSSSEYEIRPVLRGDFPRVADLLRHLTRADSSWNRDYLIGHEHFFTTSVSPRSPNVCLRVAMDGSYL